MSPVDLMSCKIKFFVAQMLVLWDKFQIVSFCAALAVMCGLIGPSPVRLKRGPRKFRLRWSSENIVNGNNILDKASLIKMKVEIGLFGRLPHRLRDKIYGYVIVNSRTIISHGSAVIDANPHPSHRPMTVTSISKLALACSQLCGELIKISLDRPPAATALLFRCRPHDLRVRPGGNAPISPTNDRHRVHPHQTLRHRTSPRERHRDTHKRRQCVCCTITAQWRPRQASRS